MATVIVNDKPVDIGNDKLNLIQAAERAGVFIPSYCWHPALTVVASCRMCLVEVGEKKPDGTVAMQPKVVPGCQTPAKDGTVIVTNSAKAKHAQEQTLESLLLNHPLDCPVCDKAGECLLQDYSYGFGRSQSRMIDDKNLPPNKPHIGEQITLFTDRCIMCSRCVRFTREIAGTSELQIVSRGHHSEIDVFPGEPCNNKLAGNVVDLCPVGALCSKDFLYKQRVWFLKDQKSVCPDCSTGCSIHIDHNKDIVYRLRPRVNPQAQGHFMCDEGRFDYAYVNGRSRLMQPGHGTSNGAAASWDSILDSLRGDLMKAVQENPRSVGFVLSPFLTCEEAYLLATFAKGLSKETRLFLGWVPVKGEDDRYPKDRRGNPVEPVKFTIRAEKCPNRRGVEAVLRHFQGEVLTWDVAQKAVADGTITALYLTAGYSPNAGTWVDDGLSSRLAKLKLLVIQDLFASPITASAQYALPAATWAEKDGTFVNHAGLAQEIGRAVWPVPDMKTDGEVFLHLLGRSGLFHARSVRAELAAEVAYFAPIGGKMPENGVMLV